MWLGRRRPPPATSKQELRRPGVTALGLHKVVNLTSDCEESFGFTSGGVRLTRTKIAPYPGDLGAPPWRQ